jgi:CubicO group peptidase (beta-lactamase class C family)
MTDLERAIQVLEQGWLKAPASPESPAKKVDLRKRMKYHKVPGFSVVLIDQEKLAWAKGFGILETGRDEFVTTDTIFQAASISKPVSAMVALHLVEAGLLDLDADVNDWLHSWKVPENKHTRAHKVTLRYLLSHTAGVSIHGYLGYSVDSPLPTLPQILDGQPPANSKPVRVNQDPGKGFVYSGGGYVLVQQLIEDVTGRSLASLTKELIFNKLGMTNSTFDSLLPQVYLPQAATAHNRKGEPVPGKWHIYPEQAAASLWTTPSDLACLIVEVFKSYKNKSNLVLSAEMTRQMLTPQVSWNGLGFLLIIVDGITKFEHPGWNEGFHSLLVGCPETGQGLVWMTNGANGKRLGREVMHALPEGFGWSGY